MFVLSFFFSIRTLHTIFALVTGVQTCALPISWLRHVRILPSPNTNAPFRELSAKLRTPLPGAAGLLNRSPRRFVPLRHSERSPILPALATARASQITLKCSMPNGICRSEEHTSELQSLMRISYAVFCLKKKKQNQNHSKYYTHLGDNSTELYTLVTYAYTLLF